MAVLDDMHTLGVTDQDATLTIYIRKATTLIKNYLMCADTVDIESTYPDAIIEYVTICMNKRGNEGLKQFTQGSRSGTYSSDLPDSVIALLPAPYATLIDTSQSAMDVILP